MNNEDNVDWVTVRNEDGSIKIFHAPNIDYSYMADGLDVDDLVESEDGQVKTEDD